MPDVQLDVGHFYFRISGNFLQCVGMRDRIMRVDGRRFTRKQVQWLLDREPMLASAGNNTELEWRLCHLAEGTLEFCLHPEIKNPEMRFGTDGGLPKEKALWREFLTTLEKK